MHMISKKDLSDAEMDTLTKSCSPTTVISANGEVQTHEEATMFVKELDICMCMLLLTVKVVENTSAVLSFAKLCEIPPKKSPKNYISSHLRKIGVCLDHQTVNQRKENLLWTPERRC